ncbi:FHA domain [Pyrobaculum sp. WP30]|nr:FHA domain [Pyrobaculum sp. WP30]
MRLVVLVVLFVVMGWGVTVSASWQGSFSGVSVFLWYVADVDVVSSKSGVWWPGEEVEVYYIAKNGRLDIAILIPQNIPLVGGRHYSWSFELRPGEVRSYDVSIGGLATLKLYGKVDLRAVTQAAGAEPATVTVFVPSRAKFRVYGTATFTTTFYAVPTVGAEIRAFGLSYRLFERQLGEAKMTPSVTFTVSSYFLYVAVLGAVVVASIAAVYIYRRRPKQLQQSSGGAYLILPNNLAVPLTGDALLSRTWVASIFPNAPWLNYISETHAVIRRRPDGWYIEDLGSQYGTYVNGRDVRGAGEVKLNPGDVISLGGVFTLIFRM